MRSSRIQLEAVADAENLREAFLKAARGKALRADVRQFRASMHGELATLRAEILAEDVAVGRFTAFTIFEPKERRIHAPCFRERVLHHALVGVCEPDFERWMIDDSYACRRGRGREAALRRAEGFASEFEWFLKIDVAKYFDSIPHLPLLGEIGRRFKDRRVVALWERIVLAYEKARGRGLPIGALTSQHLANLYLGAVDRLVKERLGLQGYVRYMDDMALWGSRAAMREARIVVEGFLAEKLGLQLKSNWHLQPTARGMDFLGYRVFPNGSRLNRASRRRFLRRLGWCERAMALGRLSEAGAQRRVLALTAFVRVARRETILDRLFGGSRIPAIGLEPREPRRQLEQLGCQLPVGEPQQEFPGEPGQQPGLSPGPQLTPGPVGSLD